MGQHEGARSPSTGPRSRLLVRVAENEAGLTWRRMRGALERMHVAYLVIPERRVTQRAETTPERSRLFTGLGLPEPRRLLHVEPTRNREA